ncbi:hypothetical protein AB0H12_18850 [Actinosynnema sp. NPDC023794]
MDVVVGNVVVPVELGLVVVTVEPGLVEVVLGVVDAGSSDDEAPPSVVVGLGRVGLLVVGIGGPAGLLSSWLGGWFRAKATTTATTAVPVPVAATA